MGILNKLFGYRWSLYFVLDGNQLEYVMHENSIMRMLGYIMGRFEDGGSPVKPWSVHLNFNRDHQSIKLEARHFTKDGMDITQELQKKIFDIDPGWQVKGKEPVFLNAKTNKKIRVSGMKAGKIDWQAKFDNLEKNSELTFYDVMDEIFGEKY